MVIREATIDDLTAIQEIYNEAIRHSTAILEYDLYSADYMQAWFEKKKINNFPVYVACENNNVLGFSSYGHFRDRPGFQYTVESTIYLHPQHRGKGLGKLLLTEVIAYATKQNLHTVIAVIGSGNTASIKLHQSLSFIKAAELKQAGFKFGRWVDVQFYQLMLPIYWAL